MDLRNHKRKRLAIGEDAFEKHFSSMLDQNGMYPDAVSIDSFDRNCHKASFNETIIEPKSFLESGEASENITISDDSVNPMIMPQEVVVYGYENAPINPNNLKGKGYISASFNYAFPSKPSNDVVNSNNSSDKSTKSSKKKRKLPGPQDEDSFTSHASLQNTPNNSQVKNHLYHDQNSISSLSPNAMEQVDQITQFSSKADSNYISNMPVTKFSKSIKHKNGLRTSSNEIVEQTFTAQTSNSIKQSQPYSKHLASSFPTKQYSLCICKHCNTEFRSPSEYLTHLRSLINTRTLCCDFCDTRLSNQSQIVSHVAFHSNVTPYFCNFCTMVFYRQSSLNFHFIYRQGSSIEKCTRCPMTFCTKTGLTDHMKIHGKSIYECEKCYMKFHDNKIFSAHKFSFHNADKKNLPFMSTDLPQRSKPVKLLTSKNKISLPKTLSFRKTSRTNLLSKTNSITTQCERKVLCKYCSKVFKRKKYLKVHLRDKICSQQETQYKSDKSISSTSLTLAQSNLVESVPMDNASANLVIDTFTCQYCSSSFRKRSYLRGHIKNRVCLRRRSIMKNKSTMNSTNNPYKSLYCQLCSTSFKKKSYLVSHIHNRVCLKHRTTFRNQTSINSTKKSESTFSCKLCSTSFKKKMYLLGHIQKLVCLKSQTTSRNKISANSPNNSVMPLSCQLCSKSFTKRSYLVSHIQNRVCHKTCPTLSNHTTGNSTNTYHGKDSSQQSPRQATNISIESAHSRNNEISITNLKAKKIDIGSKDTVCSNCSGNFKRHCYLLKHIRNKVCQTNSSSTFDPIFKRNNKANVLHSCKKCSFVFKKKRYLANHLHSRVCEKNQQINSSIDNLQNVTDNRIKLSTVSSVLCTKPTSLLVKPQHNNKVKDLFTVRGNISDNNPQSFHCDYCHRTFKHISRLQRHANLKKCFENKSLQNLSLLKYKDLIKINFPFVCTNCSAPFSSKRGLNRHFSFDVCQKKTSPKSDMSVLMQNQQSEFSNSCQRIHRNKKRINLPYKRQATPKEFSWTCKSCDKVFHIRRSAFRHATATSCSSKIWERNSDIFFKRKHSTLNTSKSQQKTSIKSVVSKDQKVDSLNQSKETNNIGEDEYNYPFRKGVAFCCIDCNELFTDILLFQGHISTGLCLAIPGRNLIGSGRRTCSGCGKKFQTQGQVRTHSKNNCKFFNSNM